VKIAEKQEKPQPWTAWLGQLVFPSVGGLAFDDFAGLNTAGADAHTLAYTVHLGLDGLQIDVPAAPSGVVGVRDVVTELRAFAAEITFSCHGYYSNLVSQKLPRIKPEWFKAQTGPWTR
jgi:hypothetical protein